MKKWSNKLNSYVGMLIDAASVGNRNLSMSITPRYETGIQKYLGYDQIALWQVIEELMWLEFLNFIGYANIRISPRQTKQLFHSITTTKQDYVEKNGVGPDLLGKGHDVIALNHLINEVLNCRYVHVPKTSYDKICTGNALMYNMSFRDMIMPAAIELDIAWRNKILEFSETLQMFRSHFQDALPGVIGAWLAVGHDRFLGNIMKADVARKEITGKTTGGIGTSGSMEALGIIGCYENLGVSLKVSSYEEYYQCKMLGLGKPRLSTQIVQPELLTRYFFELVMVSGALANLGEDTRILQGSPVGEIITASSTSSVMAGKEYNPIVAENTAGMQTTIIGEFMKPMQNQISLLQRDLKNSGPARDYMAIPAYVYYQIKNATKLLNSMSVNRERCLENFKRNRYTVMGELLHLSLCVAGMPESHKFVNKKVVPEARGNECTLVDVMDSLEKEDIVARKYWSCVPDEIKYLLLNPEKYTGLAVDIAKRQSKKVLTF